MKRSRSEINTKFFLQEVEEYQQDWLKKLMNEGTEFLHTTIENVGDELLVFVYTYNVYYDTSIYQVKVSENKVIFVRKLYKNIKVDKTMVTYESVNGDLKLRDLKFLKDIESMLNLI